MWHQELAERKAAGAEAEARRSRSGMGPTVGQQRQAGFRIRTWAEALAATKDETFLNAIDTVLARLEEGFTPTTSDGQSARPGSDRYPSVSLAIDCDGAARKVPEPLRGRLHRLARDIDVRFCSLPHDLNQKQGFAASPSDADGASHGGYTHRWQNPHRGTTAAVAVICVSRYENTGNVAYRDLIVAAADAYLDSLPDEQIDAWPLTFGQAITLQLSAFRITARPEYHRRATQLGQVAIERFFDDSPLPRASLKSDHYEATTGADTLVLALAELHLSTLHITAVRTPANTIDH
jgi:hypothetical protein